MAGDLLIASGIHALLSRVCFCSGHLEKVFCSCRKGMAATQRQVDWRAGRKRAVHSFNEMAEEVGVDLLPSRPSSFQVTEFWVAVCGASSPEHAEALKTARTMWLEHHGGGDLPEDVLPKEDNDDDSQSGASDIIDYHRNLPETNRVGAARKKAFRLKSRAFLLTFNSRHFNDSQKLWMEFLAWIHDRAKVHFATQWSSAMERSLHSSDEGRVHLHVYFSWVGPGAQGVDHRTTDEWVFAGVRPRVDVNSETRGPSYWLKATQRGHFYCSVHKKGAIYTATNYPPWEGSWVPDTAWVVSLHRQQRLDHDAYLHLSARLGDGHDRRKASIEAVRATEATYAFQEERAWARRQLLAKALPFKPLCPEIEGWLMSFEELEERYRMLVLHGPSRTGKSRLAHSLFGFDRTLVVDVQHAEHPDMHGFRRHHHVAVLLDEVADPSFIVNNKKLLQAHVDGAILGQSATQMFTYEVFLWRVPIILTTNNWDLSGLSVAELDWVHSNCVAVHVDTTVYESTRQPQTQVQVQPRPQPVPPPQQVPRPEVSAAALVRRRPAASVLSHPPSAKRVAQG